MLSNKVIIEEYTVVKDKLTGLCGVNRIRKDGTQSEVLPKVYRDVVFACSYGKKYFAIKDIETIDGYTIFNYSRTVSIDSVVDIRFLERAIWVRRLATTGKYKWNLLDEKLQVKQSTPDFLLPVFGENWHICRRVGSVAVETVSLRDEPDTKYNINLESGEYSEILSSSHKVKEVKEVTAYDIKVIDNKIISKDSNGKEKVIATVHNFSLIEPIISALLNTEPTERDSEKVYENINKALAEEFIKAISTIKTGDVGHHITYLALYVGKVYNISIGTIEFLIAMNKELSSGYTKLNSYESSGDIWEFGIKLYKIEDEIMILSKLFNDKYVGRVNFDITDRGVEISDNKYELLKIDDFEVVKSIKDLDNNSNMDLPIPDNIKNQTGLVKTIESFSYLFGDRVVAEVKDQKISLDIYFNFMYEPKENKRKKGKVYSVATYNNAVRVVG